MNRVDHVFWVQRCGLGSIHWKVFFREAGSGSLMYAVIYTPTGAISVVRKTDLVREENHQPEEIDGRPYRAELWAEIKRREEGL